MLVETNYLVGVCRWLVSWYLQLLACIIVIDLLVSFLNNPRVRYYCCYFCYIVTASIVSIIYMPVLLMRFHHPTNIVFATQPAIMMTKLLGIEWELRGEKNLMKDEAAVIAMTHQSILDILGLSVIGPALQRVWTVARKEVFYYWPFGLTIWLSGVTIFIDREKGKRSNIKLMKYTHKIKEQKMKMVMFPEGTRNRKGESLLPFKKGAFRIAIEAQIPIIPIVYSPYYFIDSEKTTFHKGKIIMSTLPPISTVGKTIADLDVLLEETHALMEEEYQNLKQEVKKDHLHLKT